MDEVKIAAIVEGHGEIEAVPILIRRIAQELEPGFIPKVFPPLRIPSATLIKQGEVEKAVEFAALKLEGRGGIVILLDCDDGCPAIEGPRLLKRATAARSDLPISVILAKKEFEAWFIASAESLRGKRRLPIDLAPADQPEAIRGAKEWLSRHMTHGKSYSEATDQPAFATLMDMELARQRADSFEKCYRDIRKILDGLRAE